jgi:hypothetical protein
MPGIEPRASDESESVQPPQEAAGSPCTPVHEMVGSERADWIDRVWCSAAGVAR